VNEAMTTRLTRRDFIKLGATSLAAAAVGYGFRDFPPGGDPVMKRVPSYTMGRVIYSMRYYDQPTAASKELGYYIRDAVVNIQAEAIGDPEPTHNPIWLRTDDGWLHSAYVQPVAEKLNEPVLKIPKNGMLAEVTVPYTQAYRIKDQTMKRVYRCYYASTYWVHYAFTSELGVVWYRIWDDRTEEHLLVEAADLRPITAEELTPISPGRADKRVEIDLAKQRLTALEGRQPVFTARIATGYFEGDTPKGEYRVERKQPTRHMASNLEGNEFDLPGVPWVCYISWTGVSFHGTYWHHNYGTPQSHGCINLNPQAAKWVYRWTEPLVPVDEDYVETDQGTPVIVF
jgi:lipoprotein-anchoring transpeptidase ErfK/SrfK